MVLGDRKGMLDPQQRSPPQVESDSIKNYLLVAFQGNPEVHIAFEVEAGSPFCTGRRGGVCVLVVWPG